MLRFEKKMQANDKISDTQRTAAGKQAILIMQTFFQKASNEGKSGITYRKYLNSLQKVITDIIFQRTVIAQKITKN